MASLSPKARELITSGRRSLRATAADRERIESALRARLGADVLPSEAPTAPSVPRAGWSAAAKTAAAVCLAGGAIVVVLAVRPATPAPRSALPSFSAGSVEPATTSPSNTQVPPTQVPELAAPPASPGPPSPAPAQRRRDPLAQEVSLLTRATSALRAGHAQDALRTLDTHQRRFPAGVLAEERRAAKAQALCMLGRVVEGRAELSQLSAGSPAAARGQRLCSDAVKPAAP